MVFFPYIQQMNVVFRTDGNEVTPFEFVDHILTPFVPVRNRTPNTPPSIGTFSITRHIGQQQVKLEGRRLGNRYVLRSFRKESPDARPTAIVHGEGAQVDIVEVLQGWPGFDFLRQNPAFRDFMDRTVVGNGANIGFNNGNANNGSNTLSVASAWRGGRRNRTRRTRNRRTKKQRRH
jgi:hypothetical protein